MTPRTVDRHARVLALVRAAGRLADPSDPLGVDARAELLASTGLSPRNIELCLRVHLESQASPREIARLVASTTSCTTVHVLLSANVFVGALRALALAVAAAPRVVVRASRREPSFARALVRALADPNVAESIVFVEEIDPAPGEEVHLYGRDETIAEVCGRLPHGVRVRAHGAGIGVALVGDDAELPEAAAALAADVVPFDQRGCLSPRVALVHGSPQRAGAFARALCAALDRWEERVPTGRLDREELADQTRFRDTVAMVGESLPAGRGVVGILEGPGVTLIAPTGRNMLVVPVGQGDDGAGLVDGLARHVAALGTAVPSGDPWGPAMAARLPFARKSALGWMQRPVFDGPVDMRHPAAAIPVEVVKRLRGN